MDKCLDEFFEKLDEIEKRNCFACSIDSPSQRGHHCYNLQRSLDGTETKYDFAFLALKELLAENKIDNHDFNLLKIWLKLN
jgi:hypothetical protein